jgi:hypothetical protein
LEWAYSAGIHPWITEYIGLRPSHLWSQPSAHEEPYSTPRSWHILSDAMQAHAEADLNQDRLKVLAGGCLSPEHATTFVAWVKQARNKYTINAILKGDQKWPSAPEDQPLLYFLAQSFRDQLAKELPPEYDTRDPKINEMVHRALGCLKTLAEINLEDAQLVIAADDRAPRQVPSWFIIEVTKTLPRITARRQGRS